MGLLKFDPLEPPTGPPICAAQMQYPLQGKPSICAGVGLLEFDPLEPPPGAPMPLPLPGAGDFEPPLPGAPSRAAEYLFASPSELWRISWREGFREDVTGRHMTADLRFRTSLAALPRSGAAEPFSCQRSGSNCRKIYF